MSRHQSIQWSLTGTDGARAGRVPILSATLSHNPLRTPQITLDVQTTIGTDALDPLSRDPATLHIVATTAGSATLRDFDAAAPPATLGELAWSDKASTPYQLDAGPATVDQSWDLQLFCTGIVQDQLAGTATVTLSSADFMLAELTNAGPAWLPTRDPDGSYRIKSSLRQLLELLDIPLAVPPGTGPWGSDGDVVVADADMKAWEPGATALAWIDELRAAHGVVWMLSATAQTMEPTYGGGPFNWYWSDATEVQAELGTEVSDITGDSRWCDGYQLLWEWTEEATDPEGEDVERTARDFASAGGKPWTQCRRIITERHSRPPTGLTAQQRLDRAMQHQLQLSVAVPMTALPEPYLDLTTWTEGRGHLTQLTYHYPAATAAVTLIGV